MNMKECKQKVKEFASKHKKKLIVASAVGVAAVGGLVGWKLSKNHTDKKWILVKKDGCVGAVLASVYATHPERQLLGISKYGDTYKSNQLGEFGEFLIGEDADLASKAEFTHILAFSKPIE